MSAAPQQIERVSTLELFFDLVFVFTITQLTAVLAGHPTWKAVLQVVLMLGVIWWMYGGYAWLTNAVAADRATRRLLLLVAMAAYLVLALAIPHAFGDDGTAFGLAYLVIVLVHTLLFTQTAAESAVRAIARLAPFNAGTAVLVLVGGVAGGTVQYVLWTAAVLLEWVTPWLTSNRGFVIGTAHFVERHGLVIIIAIGESVVAVGIGASHLPLTAELAGVAILGLLLSAALWWVYFGGDDMRAERALQQSPPERRPMVALVAFGYWHLLMLLGVIGVAAGLEEATGHPFDALHAAQASFLAAGTALFMLGEALFRGTLGIGPRRWRTGVGLAALATIPLGTSVSPVAQIAALLALIAAGLLAERAAIGVPVARS